MSDEAMREGPMRDKVVPDKAVPEDDFDPFASARVVSYANIGWEPDDVRQLRPSWDEPRARAFLERVETRLAAETLLAGWAALAALIAEAEEEVP